MDNIDSKLGSIFSDVLAEIIFTVSGFSLELLSNDKDNDFDEMTGVMSLNGKKNGILFISVKETDMRRLCSFILGVDDNNVTNEDVEDALCELVNMTAGSSKLRLSGSDYVFNLSSPFLLKSQSMNITGKKKTRIISRRIGNEEISLRIKIVY